MLVSSARLLNYLGQCKFRAYICRVLSTPDHMAEVLSPVDENMMQTRPAAKMARVEGTAPLKVKKLSEHATLPKRGSQFAAGYDLAR